ncbi:hypothetical protein CALCODRAFT_499468 [Calocera cornea HHB12733]|uniref:Uncharacterized protein n=1 Tax=Calocera cornea HHB12733 TaxID=1353952 RepID=A0A165EE56_9BASI|nr:hypothetical protein CALCODRAFT_499468 [Calocera cornea HHB12733]
MVDTDSLGAVTQLYAGTAPETASANGKHFIPWARDGLFREDANDPGPGKKLWDYVDEVTADV